MESKKTDKELENHVNKALKNINNYLHNLREDNPKKSELISYWIHDFIKMIKFEDTFKPTKNKNYKKGDVIKVNLGFNVGSEQGGLHYAVVLEKNNSQASPVITIAPLTSINSSNKSNKGLRPGKVNLGNELYELLEKKCLSEIKKCLPDTNKVGENFESDFENYIQLIADSKELNNHKEYYIKLLKEIGKMKNGSICLINQITTISKIRIYDPKTRADVLHGIRFSDKTLDLIDENIKKYFLKD